MKMEKKSTRLIILTTNKMENTLNFIKMEWLNAKLIIKMAKDLDKRFNIEKTEQS
jgi:hypothetical protein